MNDQNSNFTGFLIFLQNRACGGRRLFGILRHMIFKTSGRPFIDDDFLIDSRSALHPYNRFAKDQPLVVCRCHLNATEIEGYKCRFNVPQLG